MSKCKYCGTQQGPFKKSQRTYPDGTKAIWLSKVTCQSCANRRAAAAKKLRDTASTCSRCTRQRSPGDTLCTECRSQRIAGVASDRSQRAIWKSAGLCCYCGKAPAPGVKYCDECRLSTSKRNSKSRGLLKRQALEHYSQGRVECACCGESEPSFLTIDHIDGGGNQHRKSLGRVASQFYRWLKLNDYPPGYRVLCFNCNIARGIFGVCPHEAKRAGAPR